mgnify:CR=1 FL=1
MKLLRKIPSDTIKDSFFDICVKSKSGCNIIVGDKNYNVTIDNNEYIITEFKPDYELTEEEFKMFKK